MIHKTHISITLSTYKPLSGIMAASLAINNLIISCRGTNHQTFSKQSSSSDEELTHSIYSPAKRARKHGGRSNSSNDEKTADTDDERVSYHKIKKQRKFDPEMWDNVVAENVSCLSTGIDGLCAYTIKCKATDKVKVLQTDGRKWKKSSATRWKNFGEMRYADCRGSYSLKIMPSPYYSFMSLTGRGHDTFLCRITCKKARIWTFFWLDRKQYGWFALFQLAKMPPSVSCCWFQSAVLLA